MPYAIRAQEGPTIDSLKCKLTTNNSIGRMNAMIDLSWEYQHVNLDSAIYYGKKALKVATNLNNKEGKAQSYSALGNVYFNTGLYEVSEDYNRKALKIDQQLGNKKSIAKDKVNLGNVLQKKGEYKEAATLYFDALNTFNQLRDSASMAVVYLNIGNNLGNREEYEKSPFYYEKALIIFLKQESTIMVGHTYIALGISKVQLRDYILASDYFNRALSIFDSLDYLSGKSSVLVNIGWMHEEQEDYLKAIELYKKGLKIDEQIGDFEGQMIGKVNLASCYLNLDDLETPERYFKSVIEMATSAGSKRLLAQGYKGMYELYKKRQNYKDALTYHEEHMKWSDSLHKDTQIQAIEELDIKYKFSQQENEIEILKKQQLVNEMESSRKSTIMVSTIGFSFLFIISAILFIQYRSTKEKETQIALEQKALRAQMNPHFIFNSLNSIQRLYVERDNDRANEFTADFAELMRRILDNSERSLISLKEELETLRLYVELEKVRFVHPLEFKVKFLSNLEVDQLMVPPLIIQPFVENAIWHGILPQKKAGKIEIRISKTNNKYISVSIYDSGVGWSNPNNMYDRESKGLKITEQRIGSKINVMLPDNGGTEVSFKIHIL